MLTSTILILEQLAILLLTASGFGNLLRLMFGKSGNWGRFGWYFFGFAGLHAAILLLQSLVYLDLPLNLTSWPIFMLALVGNLHLLFRSRKRHLSVWAKRGGLLMSVFLATFFLQASPAILSGLSTYYGSGMFDHPHSVMLAQYLTEFPYSTPFEAYSDQGWLDCTFYLVEMHHRIGHLIVNGYVGVIGNTDAASAYAAVSAFYVALTVPAVYVLLRLLGTWSKLAVVGGFWCAVVPCLSLLHMAGFLSQVSVHATFPTLVAVYLVNPRKYPWSKCCVIALLMLQVVTFYTEMSAVVIGMAGMMLIVLSSSLKDFAIASAKIAAFSLGLGTLVIPHAAEFLRRQMLSVHDDPTIHSWFIPKAGTLDGMLEVFFWIGRSWIRTASLVGLGAILLVALVPFVASRGRRLMTLLGVFAIPVMLLGYLLSKSVFPAYPFQKLIWTFSVLVIALAVLGWQHLLSWGGFDQKQASRSLFPLAPLCLLSLLSLGASVREWRSAFRPGPFAECLATLRSDGYLSVSAALKSSQEPIGILDVDERVGRWMAYQNRHAPVYWLKNSPRRSLPDGSNRAEVSMSELPNNIRLVGMEGDQLKYYDSGSDPIVMLKDIPTESTPDQSVRWHWIADTAKLYVVNFNQAVTQCRVTFTANRGPSHTSRQRLVGVYANDTLLDQFVVEEGTQKEIMVPTESRITELRLEVLEPTKPDTSVPSDPRVLMLQVVDLRVQPNFQ